jgi:hypothetical protein
MKSIADNFHVSLSRMAKKLETNKFTDFSKDTYCWNMYMIPIESSDPKKLTHMILDASKKDMLVDISKIKENIITHAIFVSASFAGKNLKRGTTIMATDTFNEDENQRLERMQTAQNTKKDKKKKKKEDLVSSKLLSNDKSENEVDAKSKATSELEFLPKPEFIEFMKDLRDILNYHKDYFLMKMTSACISKVISKQVREKNPVQN